MAKMFFIVLSGGYFLGFNGSFGSPEKKLLLIIVKQRQNFAWVCITIVIVICLLTQKRFKQIIKMSTFQIYFVE